MKGFGVCEQVHKPVRRLVKICIFAMGLVFLSVDLVQDVYGESIEIVSNMEHEQGGDEKEIENEDAKEYFYEGFDYSAQLIELATGRHLFHRRFYKYSLLDLITPPPEYFTTC